MTVLRSYEDLQAVFPQVGQIEILSRLDSAQKRLNDEVRYLVTTAQLSDIATNTGWALPAGFRSLVDILLYDSNNDPLYITEYNYGHEIINNKLYIYSLTSTTITGLDASISTAYILYEYDPSTIATTLSTFTLPAEIHDGIIAGAYQELYMRYPVSQIINGTPVMAVSPTLARMWENEFNKAKRRLKKFKYTQDSTHSEAITYQHAGKVELPRRRKDIATSTVIFPISSLYTKYARWTLTYPSTVTEVTAPVGFTGTITAVIAANQLTITSTESDFSGVSDWNANQDDILINSFSSTTWVFDLPLGDWGTIRFEIFE